MCMRIEFLTLLLKLGDAPLKYVVLIEVCSVDLPVARLRISTGFKGISSERRIYESTLVGETTLLS